MFDMLMGLIKDFVDGKFKPSSMVEFLSTEMFAKLVRKPADNVMSSYTLAELYTAVIPIALILIFIAFIVQITDMMINEQFSVDKFVKNLTMLILLLMVIDNGVNSSNTGWLQTMYTTATGITDDLLAIDFAGTSGGFADKIIQSFDFENETGALGILKQLILNKDEAIYTMLTTVLTMLAMSVMSAISCFFVFAVGTYRAVKLGIYIALSPIAIACSYNKSIAGLGYLKKVLAIFLQEAVIIFSAKIVFLISASTTNFLSMFVIVFALISAITGSEARTKEMLR